MALSTSVVSADPASHETDLLALLVREGEKLGAVDASLDGLLSRCAKEEEFTGKEGQVLTLHTHGKLGAQRVAAIGIGKEKDEDRTLEQLRLAASRAVKVARAAGAKTLAIAGPLDDAKALQAAAEGASLGAYVFDRYKREKKPLKLAHVQLLVSGKVAGPLTEAARLGWPVRELPGGHLHMGVSPAEVAAAITALAAEAAPVAAE